MGVGKQAYLHGAWVLDGGKLGASCHMTGIKNLCRVVGLTPYDVRNPRLNPLYPFIRALWSLACDDNSTLLPRQERGQQQMSIM